MGNLINFATNLLAWLITIIELMLFWCPQLRLKLKRIEKMLFNLGETIEDLQNKIDRWEE